MNLEQADALAERFHEGQYDEAGRPYIEHVRRVSTAVDGHEEKLTALLHHLLEDTNMTPVDLMCAGTPQTVVRAVMSMTREPGESYKAFVVRAAMNPIARAVKFADIADNVTEARLALLEPDTAHHLRETYAEGRRLLEATASKDYTGIDFDSLLAEGKQIGWSTQYCVECGHPAGTIEIIDEEEATQVDRSVIPLSIYCHLGTASIFIDSALAERCLSALNANDTNYLYELNPEICPWWCSKCGQSYCASSWSTPSKSDNGYVDFISGKCPRGHFRKFWD